MSIGAAVADALDAAHRHGLIHRDIKPGNILITASGRALVADFGISRAIADASMTVTGTTIGSVHYFSPEQAAGEEVGPPSDIYALGIVVYEMLSGRRPFEGESAAGVALKRLNEPPPPLSTGIRPIPAALEAVVMQALARDPAQRYPDAAAFAQALRSWQSQEETAAMVAPAVVAAAAVVPPPGEPEPVPETAAPPPYHPAWPTAEEGRPWWIWVLAILAVILLGAMGFLGAELLGGGRCEPSPSADTFALPNWEGEPITQVRLEATTWAWSSTSDRSPARTYRRTRSSAPIRRLARQVSEGDKIIVFVSTGRGDGRGPDPRRADPPRGQHSP